MLTRCLKPRAPLLYARGIQPPTGITMRSMNKNMPRTLAGHAHLKEKLPPNHRNERFREFSLAGKVFAVTGGARGLGLSMAEALVEAGGEVYCLDRLPTPDPEFLAASSRANPDFGGALHYLRMDVTDDDNTEVLMEQIARKKNRFDGLIAAAGINHVESAMEHTPQAVDEIVRINYTGVFRSAVAAARMMMMMMDRNGDGDGDGDRDRESRSRSRGQGSILLVASMSGLIANKGMESAIYNSSKAAVIQLTRSLAMEWSKDGNGIRVNCLCPGHVETPMVQKIMEEDAGMRDIWQGENMMGRLGRPEEFRGVALLLMSDASSFMTGSTVVVDGGHTAW
ncbi:hypothetical protein BJX76DRAFT_346830 [Aspergillus varians]